MAKLDRVNRGQRHTWRNKVDVQSIFNMCSSLKFALSLSKLSLAWAQRLAGSACACFCEKHTLQARRARCPATKSDSHRTKHAGSPVVLPVTSTLGD